MCRANILCKSDILEILKIYKEGRKKIWLSFLNIGHERAINGEYNAGESSFLASAIPD